MNIIFSTQGSNLNFFQEVLQLLPKNWVGTYGFYVSHARSFYNSRKRFPDLKKIPTLKEWEIIEHARKSEHEILNPDLTWEAAIADRRLTFGWKCTYIEDPNPRYKSEFIETILNTAQKEIENFWDKIKPDLLVGFVPVTFGEYLLFRHAEKQNIPTLILRSVRVENYQALHDRLLGLSQHFQDLYNQENFDQETQNEAQKILNVIQKSGLVYEGTLKKKQSIEWKKLIVQFIKDTLYAVKIEIEKFINPVFRRDNHDPDGLQAWFYKAFIRPMRKITQNCILKSHPRYVSDISVLENYAFFPLHFEPEVALQIYAQPFIKNQIGLIRYIASSLPLGMKLVVKDHPRAIGYRRYSFYKELFSIPNLVVADANLPAAPIIQKSKIVTVISGTIGLEAGLYMKPVITFGYTEYAVLPDHMVRFCNNLLELPRLLQDHLRHYRYDEQACKNYIMALIKGSVRMDYYSLMLKKPGRNNFVESDNFEQAQKKQLSDFANYFVQRAEQVVDRR